MSCGKEGKFSKRQGLGLRRYSGSSPLESFDLPPPPPRFPVLGDKFLLKLFQPLLGDRFKSEWQTGEQRPCHVHDNYETEQELRTGQTAQSATVMCAVHGALCDLSAGDAEQIPEAL